jgi:imidazolonepropionase-like amidohydrolase
LVTSVPARVLGLGDEIGRLEVGAAADFCVVRAGDVVEEMVDGRGEVRSEIRWRAMDVVKGGGIATISGL